MTPSNINLSLFLGIIGTIGFDISPIMLGSGLYLNIAFVLYAGVMFVLSFSDRRVLGYATVLSACNPANYIANLSFSLMLAILTVVKESAEVGRVVRELGKRRWWWLLLAALLLVALSVPFWTYREFSFVTEIKQLLSRLGYLVVIPLAVGLTLRTQRDGVRVSSMLCLISIAFLAIFYFLGQSGVDIITTVEGGETIGLYQRIGNISLNFLRTQVCILLAVLGAASLGFSVGFGSNLRAFVFYVASGICFFMIMRLASIGSAFAMVCGMGVVVLGYLRTLFKMRRALSRVIFGILLLASAGGATYWAVFRTDNTLSRRIELKVVEVGTTGIDRRPYWEEGLFEIRKTPFGEGWSVRTGHSDWLLFLLSYGWLTGLLYLSAAGSLFSSMWRTLTRLNKTAGSESIVLPLVGLSALSVYIVNAVLDMLSANIGYYQTVWALILTPATLVAVARSTKQTTERGG